MTHPFLPPHPSPVAAAGLPHVSLGWLIIVRLACGIPAWFVSGVVRGSWNCKPVGVEVPDKVILSVYLISCALRIAQGSATVAIVTTAGIAETSISAATSTCRSKDTLKTWTVLRPSCRS